MLNAPTLPPRYPGIAKAVANHLARREIERQWRAKGLRITRYSMIVAQAQTYLLNHPELFATKEIVGLKRHPVIAVVARPDKSLGVFFKAHCQPPPKRCF